MNHITMTKLMDLRYLLLGCFALAGWVHPSANAQITHFSKGKEFIQASVNTSGSITTIITEQTG